MKKYIPSKPYSGTETIEQFAGRLQRESQRRQFVFVSMGNKKEMVSFGVGGFVNTCYGVFQVVPAKLLFGKWGWHHVMMYPNMETVLKTKNIFLRLDSGCYAGMVLGDTGCDCKKQLAIAQKQCVQQGAGIIIEIPEHDGRGYKQVKMAEKRLIDEAGLNDKEAADLFHGKDFLADIRTFDEAVAILKVLGFKDHIFDLMTDNPKKVKAFKEADMKLAS